LQLATRFVGASFPPSARDKSKDGSDLTTGDSPSPVLVGVCKQNTPRDITAFSPTDYCAYRICLLRSSECSKNVTVTTPIKLQLKPINFSQLGYRTNQAQ